MHLSDLLVLLGMLATSVCAAVLNNVNIIDATGAPLQKNRISSSWTTASVQLDMVLLSERIRMTRCWTLVGHS